jgi:probable phosphoglycerate mutase
VAAALRDEGIHAIYASDLQRAFETAQAISQVIGAPIVADPGLRERAFGDFETLTHADIEAHWPEAARRWRERDPDFAPAGGESLRDFHARCIGAVARLAAAHAGQTIAIVAHGGVMDCLYRAATRIDLQAPRSWALGNASINRLLYSPEGFTLVGWSDTRHLDEAALDESSDGKVSPGI